jgi:membrane AbrB-like protein
MIGPLVIVTIAALSGLPLETPFPLRPFVMPAIGVMLGSAITPAVLQAALHWWVTVLLLIPLLILQGALSYQVIRRLGRADPITAYFAGMPGGLTDMVLLGTAMGGDERRIALAHASRVLVVIVTVVLIFGWGLHVTTGGHAARWTSLDALTGRDWLILTLCGAAGSFLALRLPAGMILGPMILSGVVHGAGWVTVPPPSVIVNFAQVVIGTIVGCRFAGATWGQVGRDLWVGALAALAMLAASVGFALLVPVLSDVPLTQAILAFSPGGLTEMSLLSFAMGQDVAYVSVTHITRIVLVIAFAGPIYARLRR